MVKYAFTIRNWARKLPKTRVRHASPTNQTSADHAANSNLSTRAVHMHLVRTPQYVILHTVPARHLARIRQHGTYCRRNRNRTRATEIEAGQSLGV